MLLVGPREASAFLQPLPGLSCASSWPELGLGALDLGGGEGIRASRRKGLEGKLCQNAEGLKGD